MMRRIVTALILAQFLAAPSFADNFQKAADAYKRGDYQTAFKEWRPLAANGNANAQYNLGLMHMLGKGITRDYAVAAEWYLKAADQGVAQAQSGLGFLYFQGYGVPRDVSKAIKWYRKAAAQAYSEAQLSLGVMYHKGVGLPRNYTKAREWYRKAADQGYAAAQYSLGAMYLTGQGVQKNRETAVEWYRKAALRGHVDARRVLYELAAETSKADGPPQRLYAMQVSKPGGAPNSTAKGYQVQLAAVKEVADGSVDEKAKKLTRTHAPVLGSLRVVPMRADLGGKGIYYRFRTGPLPGRAAAETLCIKLKARQQACLVVPPTES